MKSIIALILFTTLLLFSCTETITNIEHTTETSTVLVDSIILNMNYPNSTSSSTILKSGSLYKIKANGIIIFNNGNDIDPAYSFYSPEGVWYKQTSWYISYSSNNEYVWLRPSPDEYNYEHVYYYYFVGYDSRISIQNNNYFNISDTKFNFYIYEIRY